MARTKSEAAREIVDFALSNRPLLAAVLEPVEIEYAAESNDIIVTVHTKPCAQLSERRHANVLIPREGLLTDSRNLVYAMNAFFSQVERTVAEHWGVK